MNIAETRRDGNLILAPSGRIVDLANLEYISSTGLSAFLSAAKKIRAAGGRMALAGLNSRIRLVFEMSGFLRLFPIYANVDAAVAG
jgi:anti-anti-sigma factor